MEYRYHLRADAIRGYVPGGGDRLVQPVRDHLEVVEHTRRGVLPGDAGGGLEVGMSRGVQHRSGGAVHGGGVHGEAVVGGGGGEQLREGAGVRQSIRRAALEDSEIRRYLYTRL